MADFTMKRGDLLPSLTAVLSNGDGDPVDLTAASDVRLALRLQSGAATKIIYSSMVKDPDQTGNRGKASYGWTSGDTDVPGSYQGEIVVTFSGKEQTFPTVGFFSLVIEDDLESH